MVLTIFACVENSLRNSEPNADQQSVETKPINASSMAKAAKAAIFPPKCGRIYASMDIMP